MTEKNKLWGPSEIIKKTKWDKLETTITIGLAIARHARVGRPHAHMNDDRNNVAIPMCFRAARELHISPATTPGIRSILLKPSPGLCAFRSPWAANQKIESWSIILARGPLENCGKNEVDLFMARFRPKNVEPTKSFFFMARFRPKNWEWKKVDFSWRYFGPKKLEPQNVNKNVDPFSAPNLGRKKNLKNYDFGTFSFIFHTKS